MDDGEGGRAALNFDEKSFLFEWLVENNKTLTRKNKELLVENLKLRSRAEELEKINFVDPTTGLHNRWYLQPRLEEEFSRARRAGSSLSCLFIDLDDFKAVNDQYGHFIGDKVLRDTANLLRGLCRREDVLVRFGADEFVILLGNAGQRAAKTAAERIRGRLQAHRFACGEQEDHPLRQHRGEHPEKGTRGLIEGSLGACLDGRRGHASGQDRKGPA